MSDQAESDERKGKAAGGKTLSLRRNVDSGRPQRNFSQNRSTKQVVVEKKRKRTFKPGGEAEAAPAAKPAEAPKAEPKKAPAPAEARKAEETPAPAAAKNPDAPKEAPKETAKAEAPAKTEVKKQEPAAEAPAAEAPAEKPVEAKAEKAPAEAKQAEPAPAKPEAKPKAEAKTGSRTETKSDNEPRRGGRAPAGNRRQAGGRRSLTADEQQARMQAVMEARQREKVEAQRRVEEAERRKIEDAEKARKAAEEARRKEAEEAERKAREEAEPAAAATPSAADAVPVEAPPAEGRENRRSAPAADAGDKRTARTGRGADEEEGDRNRKRGNAAPTPSRRGEPRRRTGKLTVTSAFDEERQRSLASMRRRREREKRGQEAQPQQKISREVVLPETITIQEFANRMAERAVDVIKILMKQGMMLKINDVIDSDTAELIAEELGHKVRRVSEADVEVGIVGEDDPDAAKLPRAPVVTVMGHVDHGKTSLLDALRKADVVSGEAGGITQHIGAYQVDMGSGDKITFIDTPGHAAFTAMRARGAKVTDIVILVVAADDGVMPQTIEAIDHAKAANVPMIVAINKIDKPEADPTRVKQELLQHEVVIEEFGGDTLFAEISAKTGQGLDRLEEAILLQAELLDIKANPNRNGEGIIVEAQLDRGRGPVGTVLITRGTLHVGDIAVAGSQWGKVRALINDRGEQVDEAGPSVPVEVLGLSGAPEAGDMLVVVENEARAREITEYRQRLERDKRMSTGARTSLDQMLTQLKEQDLKELPLLVKSDVQGSAEAISQAIEKLGTDEVQGRVIHSGVGGITESDVTLAAASGAPIIGFNVRANTQARQAAEEAGVEIRYYSVIYDLVDDVKAAMSGLLSPDMRETFLGNAEILEVFNITKVGKVAGCRVTDGTIRRGSKVRLIRDNVVVHEGDLATLKRFKDEVRDVQAGQECGMAFENYQDMRAGDVIECFQVEEVQRTL